MCKKKYILYYVWSDMTIYQIKSRKTDIWGWKVPQFYKISDKVLNDTVV